MNPTDRLLLERSQLFCDIDLECVEHLIDACPETRLAAGDTLLQQGARNTTLYLVLDGQLRVYLSGPDLPEHTQLNAGECVGEMSVIDGRRASALVMAAQDTRLLAIDHEILWAMIEVSYGIARNLLAILSGRIRFNNLTLISTQSQSLEFERSNLVDALTGLHNKRWVADAFPRAISRCERDGVALCLVLGDLDNFKRINESHGNLNGDNLLRLLARRWAEILRPQDMLARYGVEQFVFLLPTTDLSDALKIAERMRIIAADTRLAIDADGTYAGVTMSLGVATMNDGDTLEALIENAEIALRRAKEAGRNRVEVC